MKIIKFIKTRSPLLWFIIAQFVVIVIIALRLDINKDMVFDIINRFASSPFAIPSVFIIYILASFINIPQWMLHGASVFSFGPWLGSILAWAATMLSASINFWVGNRLGAIRVEKLSGGISKKFLQQIRKNGFWASLIVRIIPTGPFVFVNMAAGVAGIRFAYFFLGTAIGTIPKIILMAGIGESARGAASGSEPVYIAIAVGVALIGFALLWLLSKYFRNKAQENP